MNSALEHHGFLGHGKENSPHSLTHSPSLHPHDPTNEDLCHHLLFLYVFRELMTNFGGCRTMRRSMMIDTRHHSSVQDQTDGKTILGVEDNEDMGTFLVLMLLTESPYQALLVTDGFQALKIVHDLKPSLFLLDYQLPDMDGIALYDRLHAITDLADIPAIIISANLPTRAIHERHLTGVSTRFDADH